MYGTPDSLASPRSLIQLREAALQADAYSTPVPAVGSSLVRLSEAEPEWAIPFVTLPWGSVMLDFDAAINEQQQSKRDIVKKRGILDSTILVKERFKDAYNKCDCMSGVRYLSNLIRPRTASTRAVFIDLVCRDRAGRRRHPGAAAQCGEPEARMERATVPIACRAW